MFVWWVISKGSIYIIFFGTSERFNIHNAPYKNSNIEISNQYLKQNIEIIIIYFNVCTTQYEMPKKNNGFVK